MTDRIDQISGELDREALAARVEAEIRPLLGEDKYDGGYNCCSCATYDFILDHALAIIRGQEYVHPWHRD